MQAPVLLLVYNRLDTLQKVWTAIRQARPKYFFISGDGPKADPVSEERVGAVRRFCETHIDWPCEAYFQWLSHNHGHKKGVLAGIRWFFSQVPEGIILEDDTLPTQDFFPFCERLLTKYRNDTRVGMIGGFNGVPSEFMLYQYDFIRFPLVWGWASWRRTWEGYDADMQDWQTIRQTDFLDRVAGPSTRMKRFLQRVFDKCTGLRKPFLHSWDYPLTYHFLKHSYLTIFPKSNLVTNLGFGHTEAVNTNALIDLPPVQPYAWDLLKPPFQVPNYRAEKYLLERYWAPPLGYQAYRRVKIDLREGLLVKRLFSRQFWKKTFRIALQSWPK